MTQRRREARALLDAGKTRREIADLMGLSLSGVYSLLPPQTEATKEVAAQVKAMRATGMTRKAIGAELGISRQWVSVLLDEEPPEDRHSAEFAINVRAPRPVIEAVRAKAQALGLLNVKGPNPEGGSINKLFDAIADGRVILQKST